VSNRSEMVTPVIVRVEEPDDSLVMLAQYQLNSIAALEQKLAQYPKGTRFTLDVQSLDARTSSGIVAALTKFAEAQGITLRR
jgi:glycine cleavage system regulatory protein